MAEIYCVRHFDQIAKEHCAICNKPYCADCLFKEADQIICGNCQEIKTKAAEAEILKNAAKPLSGGSPLNFKGKGMDDDPLGLFAGTAKSAPPKVEAPVAFTPRSPSGSSPILPSPSGDSLSSSPEALVISEPSILSPIGKPTPVILDQGATAPPLPGSQSKLSEDLNAMLNDPRPLRPPFPKTSSSNPDPEEKGELQAPGKTIKYFSIVKTWMKFLLRKAYMFFEPLSKKLRIPTYALLGLIAVLLFGIVIGMGSILEKPTVALVDRIQPIHLIQESSSQVSEMDIIAYAEFQTQLQNMGFTPIMQMSVPQLPSPNFFDVQMKESAGIYSEIIKMPGKISPHLSFVSVFTNGIWVSTNAWDGENQTLEYLLSEYYPNDNPDQLYALHVQRIEKLKQEKGWAVQMMGENRYMAALSDHLRWFLNKKDIEGYQADFKMWH